MEQFAVMKTELDQLWHLAEAERDQLFDKLQDYADKQGTTAFVQQIRSNFELVEGSGINKVYIALCESNHYQRWSDFFVAEFQRGFQMAEQASDPLEVLEPLKDIYFRDEQEDAYRDQMVRFLEGFLQHNRAAIRHQAIYFLSDWIYEEDNARYSHVIQKIAHLLQKDEDWKVRLKAYGFLSFIECLPQGYRRSIWDSVRAMFSYY